MRRTYRCTVLYTLMICVVTVVSIGRQCEQSPIDAEATRSQNQSETKLIRTGQDAPLLLAQGPNQAKRVPAHLSRVIDVNKS